MDDRLTLHQIGIQTGTDKAHEHKYLNFYEQHLGHLRDEKIRFLEIGVLNGASIAMWKRYFTDAEIHGIDIVHKHADGWTFHPLDCEDATSLKRFSSEMGKWDVVIDDGGHTMKQQQLAFKHLWGNVKRGGYFVMEDLHTSFMPHPKFNLEKMPTAFSMIETLGEDSSEFSSPIISAIEFGELKETVDWVSIYTRVPGVYDNSVTAVVRKRE